ncbi:hypothetical protein F4780DRAFT_1464 [Xylariomycetidae sp. FL0641]|nr:hypothetical protein F4780DRAFT_1464 [Xylariomycetidae sp. FL0641]
MQSVPSLVGSSTAVAAAATGLIFGQYADGQLPPSSPDPNKRKPTPERAPTNNTYTFPSRPATRSSAAPTPAPAPSLTPLTVSQPTTAPAPAPVSSPTTANYQSHPPTHAATADPDCVPYPPPRYPPRRHSHAQTIPPKPINTARYSIIRQDERVSAPTIAEAHESSSSSGGSWMRRLSIRPLSQHESLRSSVGPDSPSIFSFGSAAPILPSAGTGLPQQARNKLVKRASATQPGDSGFPQRRGSRSQMILRRPATSHQRSATLQQQLNSDTLSPLFKPSLDQDTRSRAQTLDTQPPESPAITLEKGPSAWKSFWHSRLAKSVVKSSPLRRSEINAQSGTRRICTQQKNARRVYLLTPSALKMGNSSRIGASDMPQDPAKQNIVEDNTQGPESSKAEKTDADDSHPSSEPTATTLKRSISAHFGSPTNWIPKTGSIRRRKRGETTTGADKRHTSAPDSPHSPPKPSTMDQTSKEVDNSNAEPEPVMVVQPPEGRRDTPSPIPPLSRLSSFHIELNRLGSSPSASQVRVDEPATTGKGTRVSSNASHTRTLEQASTVGSSEYHRGFTSGDDDDTDTAYDSFRTTDSGRRRTVDSPLESMFDESPPSTAGTNVKPQRLSIQEILGPAFDAGSRIMEEDESASTPVGGSYEGFGGRIRNCSSADDDTSRPCTAQPALALDQDCNRLSLDDDDDLDWAREDDVEIYNHLSPPSSMNSRRGSPSLRMALAAATGNDNPEVRFDIACERHRSTVFDWAEPPVHDKYDGGKMTYRPKTVHGKQELDMRGGRTASRKGPIVAHVRSQSVPVVQDQADTANSTPKFGTWGLSQKNVSEDWDDDFVFDEGDQPLASDKKQENRGSMFVPASIQATQPTVKAHSGQIRELSLLVNDLKRLCRLGREMNMLGSSTKLWRDAEGIIALASPDDEDTSETLEEDKGFGATTFENPDALGWDHGFDGASVDEMELLMRTEQPRNAVVRERTAGRRRSVFSPEDDIFGNWDQTEEEVVHTRPRTPINQLGSHLKSNNAANCVLEAMNSRPSKSSGGSKLSKEKLNFDTNSLKELVKRASDLRDSLSDLVRKADHTTPSPVRTPKHTRADGSPAFTRVFDEPISTPPRRIAPSRSSNSILSGSSVSASSPNGLNQRMQMMTVS